MIFYNLYVSFVNGKIDEFNSDHGELVGENDTNDSSELEEGCNINYGKGCGLNLGLKF